MPGWLCKEGRYLHREVHVQLTEPVLYKFPHMPNLACGGMTEVRVLSKVSGPLGPVIYANPSDDGSIRIRDDSAMVLS